MPGQSLCSDTGADMASDVVGLGKHATCRCRCGSTIKHSLSITIDSPGCTMPSPKSPTSPSKRPRMQVQVSSGTHRCRFVFDGDIPLNELPQARRWLETAELSWYCILPLLVAIARQKSPSDLRAANTTLL